MRLLPVVIAVAFSFLSSAVAADSRVRVSVDEKSGRTLYTLVASKAPLSAVAAEVAKVSGRVVTVEPAARNVIVTAAIADATEPRLFEEIAAKANLWAVTRDGRVSLQATEPVASIDVKDEDVRSILRSLQTQCGVRNLVLDPNVVGKGTFLFRDVPCRQAFSVVFTSLGLAGEFSGRSVAAVSTRR